ncbi:hypothetical protein NQ318_018947 [Aromia moschata]|uniref:Uncharacterized protein n=1 Tax=Aromia moschata TaxID=1265417 RepID=A0AAV8ZGL8_9CUCU|nr:hypothetical protein NQ318_018947 [Aromia moschata]
MCRGPSPDFATSRHRVFTHSSPRDPFNVLPLAISTPLRTTFPLLKAVLEVRFCQLVQNLRPFCLNRFHTFESGPLHVTASNKPGSVSMLFRMSAQMFILDSLLGSEEFWQHFCANFAHVGRFMQNLANTFFMDSCYFSKPSDA